MDDVLVCLGIPLAVVHIPAKRLKERIDELPPYLGFVVGTGFVGIKIALEALN